MRQKSAMYFGPKQSRVNVLETKAKTVKVKTIYKGKPREIDKQIKPYLRTYMPARFQGVRKNVQKPEVGTAFQNRK